MPSDESDKAVRFVLLTPVIGVVLFLVASYFLALLLGPTLFFLTSEGLQSSGQLLRGLPIQVFVFFDLYIPIRFTLGSVFLFLWGIYLICFIVSWRWRESFHHVIGKSLSRPAASLFHNWLFSMVLIASMLLAAFVLITAFQDVAGVDTGVPSLPEDPFEAYLSLSYAALIEEIGFRISPIGLFLVFYLFSAGRNTVVAMSIWQRIKFFLVALLYPEKAKKIVGLKTVGANGFREGISLGEWVVVLVTATIFGLMHFVVGIGWGPGKITTAFMNGFVFGLVYLTYGFQAPILLHWFLNYYFYTYYLAADFYPSVFSLVVLIDVVNLFLGLFALLAFGILALRRRPKVTLEGDPFEYSPSLQNSHNEEREFNPLS